MAGKWCCQSVPLIMLQFLGNLAKPWEVTVGLGFGLRVFFSSSVLSGKVIAVQLFGTCCSRGTFEQVEGAFNGQCRTWSLIVMNYFFYGSREKFKLVASRRLLCI